ncbi:MAG: DUF805 domain-containing protein [Candidatus Sumerlaeia bacterium]|nr:DUF805 domain-containing protein [Candidatus Sumerlaeia bacterium]
MNEYITVLKKYAVFTGRARRREYWMFILVHVCITFLLGMLEGILEFGDLLSVIYALAVLLPNLAVLARRLHDIGQSGWWILIGLVPCIGWIVILFFTIQEGTPGKNEYGPNPKEVPQAP